MSKRPFIAYHIAARHVVDGAERGLRHEEARRVEADCGSRQVEHREPTTAVLRAEHVKAEAVESTRDDLQEARFAGAEAGAALK